MALLRRDWMLLRVILSNYNASASLGLNPPAEFIDAEERFTYVRDALKTLNKMDMDKLIATV